MYHLQLLEESSGHRHKKTFFSFSLGLWPTIKSRALKPLSLFSQSMVVFSLYCFILWLSDTQAPTAWSTGVSRYRRWMDGRINGWKAKKKTTTKYLQYIHCVKIKFTPCWKVDEKVKGWLDKPRVHHHVCPSRAEGPEQTAFIFKWSKAVGMRWRERWETLTSW